MAFRESMDLTGMYPKGRSLLRDSAGGAATARPTLYLTAHHIFEMPFAHFKHLLTLPLS